MQARLRKDQKVVSSACIFHAKYAGHMEYAAYLQNLTKRIQPTQEEKEASLGDSGRRVGWSASRCVNS